MIKLHPFTLILLSLNLLISILFYNHPFYIVSISIILIINILTINGKRQLISTLKITGLTALLILIINPIVANEGRIVIYNGMNLPVIGNFRITLEGIVFGGVMGIKLIAIAMVFVLYSIINDPDDTFSFFSKYAHRLTLTLSMTTNIIHRLKLEILRIKDVMILRGANFNEKGLLKKIKSYYPILKVILISSLEGSLSRAEALYSKAYGKTKRTMYSKLEISKIDYAINGLSIIYIGLFSYGIAFKRGRYSFYPKLTVFNMKDIMYLAILTIPIIIGLILIWGCKKWKFLKYKI